MDSLIIKNLEIYANHGLYSEEKVLGQKFLISIRVDYNMKEVATEKNLRKSIDYGKLSHEIKELFENETEDLIETCGYKILEYIFKNYKIAREVEVSIKKPWAPINLPLDSAEIIIKRKMRNYFISIGTNMGDKEKNISDALNMIREKANIINESSRITTKAWGLTDQDDFLNMAIEVESYEEPEDFLKILQNIEDELGRVRKIKWGPRLIDLDILFVDDEVIYTKDLKVPHPYIEQRDFVLDPLNEIAPFFVHPVLNKSIMNIVSDRKKEVIN